jgi:very-short-patch-repair endonuclease
VASATDLPTPIREYEFAKPERKFRFDLAFLDVKLAVEVHGGEFAGGRHTRGKGLSRDCEKNNLAIRKGWRVLAYTGSQVRADPVGIAKEIEATYCLINGELI